MIICDVVWMEDDKADRSPDLRILRLFGSRLPVLYDGLSASLL
jgi:hypothetical protein